MKADVVYRSIITNKIQVLESNLKEIKKVKDPKEGTIKAQLEILKQVKREAGIAARIQEIVEG